LVNSATGTGSTVSGGRRNTASTAFSTVSGGDTNAAVGEYSTISGGGSNSASFNYSTVGGGQSNISSGQFSTVGGGYRNTASGHFSWAGGTQAKTFSSGASPTTYHGSFIWADSNYGGSAQNFYSVANDEFAVRARGGVRFVTVVDGAGAPTRTFQINGSGNVNTNGNITSTARITAGDVYTDFLLSNGQIWAAGSLNSRGLFSEGNVDVTGNVSATGTMTTAGLTSSGNVTVSPPATLNFGTTTRQMINLWGTSYGIGIQNNTNYFRTQNNFAWYSGGVHNDLIGNPGTGGTTMMSLTSSGLTVNGTVTPSSDRNKKENFAEVDARQILEKVANLPIQQWNYIADDSKVPHIGPMAQDFYAAFNIGADDKHIATVDADGVALAAIKALKAENDALKADNEGMKERLVRIEKQLFTLKP
jgi:hypothetical protein